MISGNARNTEPFGLCSDVFYICIHGVVLSGGDIHERMHGEECKISTFQTFEREEIYAAPFDKCKCTSFNINISYGDPTDSDNSICCRDKEGVAAQAVLSASRPAGYVQAFTFNMAVNGKVEYTLKNGVLTIIIPKEFRKAGRTFAIMALDKNGKAVIFNDTDTNADTVTAAINVEGYAFSLIYKD